MLRKLAILLLPAAILLGACSDGGNQSAKNDDGQADPPAAEADADGGSDDNGDALDGDSDVDEGGEAPGDGAGSSDNPLFASLNPLDLLGAVEGPSSGPPDADLAALLLDTEDLPPGFLALGEFGSSAPTEFGDALVAANAFTNGDAESEDMADMGTMVMSAAIELPPDALDEIQQGLDEVEDIDNEDLQAELGEFEDFATMELMDVGDLGDGGFGMRVSMDFGAIFGAFGAPDSEADPKITIEAVVFLQGERALMVMTIWPDSESAGADARDLASVMADRAG